MANARRGLYIRVGYSVFRDGLPEDLASVTALTVIFRHICQPNSSVMYTAKKLSTYANTVSATITDADQVKLMSGDYKIEVYYRRANPTIESGYEPYVIDAPVFTLTDTSTEVNATTCGDITIQTINLAGEVSFCSEELEALILESKQAITDAEAATQAAIDAASAAMAIVDSKIDLDGLNSNIRQLKFNTATPVAPTQAGQLAWSDEEGTLALHNGLHTHPIGRETFFKAKNNSGALIANGKAVYAIGSTGANATIGLATTANGDIAQRTIGIATMDIPSNGFGDITTFGEVNDINTSALSEGALVYLGLNGNLTSVEPVAPMPKISLGLCIRSHLTQGRIAVYVRPIARLNKLTDVYAPNLLDGDVLRWNGTALRYEVYNLVNKADLVGGKVPASQLPAYVDDILEYATFAAFPLVGETSKLYVTLDTNLTYRWSGSAYTEVSKSLAIGITSTTAFRGDWGKIAYDHSQLTNSNPHGTTAAQITNTPAGTISATTVQAAINELDADRVQLETDLNLVIENYIDIIPTSIITNEGYYNYSTGIFTPYAGYKSIELLTVYPGDKLYVSGTTRSLQTSLIHTYNSEGVSIGFELRGTGVRLDYVDHEYIIPTGVSMIGVTSTTPDGLQILVKKATGKISKSYTKNESNNLFVLKTSESTGYKTYGVKWDRTNKSDYGQRTKDSIGLNATIGIGDQIGSSHFDYIYPWSEIKRCNLTVSANGAKIVTFEGDTGFTLNGSNGDVFVRIPKFCVSKKSEGNYDYIEISQVGIVHPAFVENGKELDEIFVSAFEGAMFGGSYVSAAGLIPESNRTPQEFLNLAKARGIGYTLYDMRTVDLIYCLFAVEFGNRNTNRILGYGLANFWQGVNQSSGGVSFRSLYSSASTNQITIPYVSEIYKYMQIGSNMVICQNNSQFDIKAFRKITNSALDNQTTPTTITFTFNGDPVSIDTTCFVGSSAQDTNWCEICYAITNDITKQLGWHTGRANLQYNSIDVRTINPMRYRWIENIVGNLWHYLPDVSFNNLQMYVCDNIADYEMHKYTTPYKPKSDLFIAQTSNGAKDDVIGQNYWITKFNYDVFSKNINIGREWNLNQQSKDGFGAYYYMQTGNMIIANGGGFDHLWRCNILTNRAWITTNQKWYLYGARLIYKNILVQL